MAIPIRNYIEIKTQLVASVAGERDFSGMVFSVDGMKATVPAAYADIKAKYEEGKPVALDSAGIAECFDTDTDVALFAGKYFGYSGGTRTPGIINVCKVLTTAKAAYDACIEKTVNFGAFTFIGDFSLGDSGDGGLYDVAQANDSSDAMLQMVVACDSSTVDAFAAALSGLQMTHLVVATPEDESGSDIGTNFGAFPAVAWYASVNYNSQNASATIDYKQFGGEPAEVTTGAEKSAYDSLNVNYIGEVKTYGSTIRFYQTGVNMNGVDMGAMRDAAWIKGQIEAGYFDLQLNSQKLAADLSGEAAVQNLVVGIANRAIGNGSILIEKPLDALQIALVNQYANNPNAADQVQSAGYYVSTQIVKVDKKYHVQYTLIYGKGDHIVKVEGTHVLV